MIKNTALKVWAARNYSEHNDAAAALNCKKNNPENMKQTSHFSLFAASSTDSFFFFTPV